MQLRQDSIKTSEAIRASNSDHPCLSRCLLVSVSDDLAVSKGCHPMQRSLPSHNTGSTIALVGNINSDLRQVKSSIVVDIGAMTSSVLAIDITFYEYVAIVRS